MRQSVKLYVVVLLLFSFGIAFVNAQEAVPLAGIPTCTDQHKSVWVGHDELIFDSLPDMYESPSFTSQMLHPGFGVHPPRQHPATILMGPECHDNFVWWLVAFDDTGNIGWVVEARVIIGTPVGERSLPAELLQAPVASPTPSNLATNTPRQTTTSVSLGDVLFEDSFDNNNSGWFVSNEISIENGAMNLQLVERNAPLFTNTTTEFPLYEPYQFSFDISGGECSTRCALEVFFNVRLNSNSELVHNRVEYYYGSPYGRNVGQAIWRGFADDNLRRRFETEDRRAAKINVFDGATHTVKLIVDEGQTTLLINDIVVSTLYSSIVPIGGNVGFGINRRDQSSIARMSFDNMRITQGAGIVGTALTVEPSVLLNQTAIAHNLGLAIPMPDTWQTANTGNSFSFSIVSPTSSSGEELGILAEFGTRSMFDARVAQDVARTAFTTGTVGTFTNVELNGVSMLKADALIANEVRGAAFVRQMRDNYFLIFAAVASSRQHWLEVENDAYAIISGIRFATNEELAQNQPELRTSSVPNGRTTNVGGFDMTLPEGADVRLSPLSVVTSLANFGTSYEISYALDLTDTHFLRFWTFDNGYSSFLNAVRALSAYGLAMPNIDWEHARLGDKAAFIMRMRGIANLYGVFMVGEDGRGVAFILDSQGNISAATQQLINEFAASVNMR